MSLSPTSARKAKASPPWAANATTSSAQVGPRQAPSWSVVEDAGALWPVRLLRAIRSWRVRRTSYRELSALSDRDLKDIGLARGKIESVIYGTPEEGLQRYERSKGDFAIEPVQSRESRNSS
jgi:uncharacterized protein YjiS (DUF1127 family)